MVTPSSHTVITAPFTGLTSKACTILSASLAQSTRNSYRKSWDLFLQLSPSSNVLPLNYIALCNFIAALFNNNYSPSSIASHVSAISYVHKILALPDPSQSFMVRKMLRGCQNLARPGDSRLPITADILKKLISALDSIVHNMNFRLITRTVFLLAFHAFMRLGELVVRKPSKVHSVLQRSDITFLSSPGTGGVQITLRNFKYNHEKTPVIIFLQANADPRYCPVASLLHYLEVFRHKSGPLFQFIDGKPVPASFISMQLHKAIQFIGLNTNYYKGHSFRIGAATHAANLGFSENYIQKLGRWNSNAIRRYIRINSFQL